MTLLTKNRTVVVFVKRTRIAAAPGSPVVGVRNEYNTQGIQARRSLRIWCVCACRASADDVFGNHQFIFW